MNKKQLTELQGYGCVATTYQELLDWIDMTYGLKVEIVCDDGLYNWKVENIEQYEEFEGMNNIDCFDEWLCKFYIIQRLLMFIQYRKIIETLDVSYKEFEVLKKVYNWENSYDKKELIYYVNLFNTLNELKEKGFVEEDESNFKTNKEIFDYFKLIFPK